MFTHMSPLQHPFMWSLNLDGWSISSTLANASGRRRRLRSGSRSYRMNSRAVSPTWPPNEAGVDGGGDGDGDGDDVGVPLPRPPLPRPPHRPRPRPAPPPRAWPSPWMVGSSLTVVVLWREEDLVASAGERPRPRPLAMAVNGRWRRREGARRCLPSSSRVPFIAGWEG